MISLLTLYASAVFLGALHAFEPGHGKTMIAAYMIGTRGRAWDGVVLGTIVTVTHTFSVILLGIAAMFLSKTYADEVLHNWLGLLSAGLILLAGLWMLRQRFSDTNHGHHHPHDEHNHAHPHEHPHADPVQHAHSPAAVRPKSKLELLLLGMSGGIIPCPAAIATLLAALAVGKIGQGLSVTLFFSLGLGGVMITIGVLLSQSRHLVGKISDNLELARKMGIASAVLIIVLGCYALFHSVKDIWF
ncbi:sulfite exporter TauE/SafE family protein [Candidatus Electronema sp. PJ]|uniref:HoxN/HupN/NixA family nickel/cobalt transporter n=1 Tax=Candidatus Electronema sp. PJ TaxID=3401572 RepID=UPI003AA81CCF